MSLYIDIAQQLQSNPILDNKSIKPHIGMKLSRNLSKFKIPKIGMTLKEIGSEIIFSITTKQPRKLNGYKGFLRSQQDPE